MEQPRSINDLEGQPDDRFMVIVSDSPDMANPSILREWNNDDSELVFNHIPHTGIPVSIPLTGIPAQILCFLCRIYDIERGQRPLCR